MAAIPCRVEVVGATYFGTFDAETLTAVNVTLASDAALNALCAGAPRNGRIVRQDTGAMFNVRLPGSFTAGTRHASFRKLAAVPQLLKSLKKISLARVAAHPSVKPAVGIARLAAAAPAAVGDAPVPNILDVLNKNQKAPSATSVLAVPADYDAGDEQKIMDIMLLDSYVSVMAAGFLYQDPEYAQKGPDITTPEGAAKFTRLLANCRLRVMTEGLAGVLSLSESSAQSFSKSTTSADLHMSFLTNFFGDFGFNDASMKQLDGILTNIVKSLSDLQASWSDSSQTLDHMISIYYLEGVMGSNVKIAKIRLFFLHIDQKSWTLSIGKSSVSHFEFHMNYADQIAAMNSEVLKDLRDKIKEYIETQTKTSLDNINKLVAMAAIQSDKKA